MSITFFCFSLMEESHKTSSNDLMLNKDVKPLCDSDNDRWSERRAKRPDLANRHSMNLPCLRAILKSKHVLQRKQVLRFLLPLVRWFADRSIHKCPASIAFSSSSFPLPWFLITKSIHYAFVIVLINMKKWYRYACIVSPAERHWKALTSRTQLNQRLQQDPRRLVRTNNDVRFS